MQAPYQTLQKPYLGFREAVAACAATVCTIVEETGPEWLAWSGFSRWINREGQEAKKVYSELDVLRETNCPSWFTLFAAQSWRGGGWLLIIRE
jgi:hypothetical protein